MSNTNDMADALEYIAHRVRGLVEGVMMKPPTDAVPMQPLCIDHEGLVRFRSNKLVRYLLDVGPMDMNKLALLPGVPREDYAQFAQLIGYSVFGYGELPYALGVEEADYAARELLLKENS